MCGMYNVDMGLVMFGFWKLKIICYLLIFYSFFDRN